MVDDVERVVVEVFDGAGAFWAFDGLGVDGLGFEVRVTGGARVAFLFVDTVREELGVAVEGRRRRIDFDVGKMRRIVDDIVGEIDETSDVLIFHIFIFIRTCVSTLGPHVVVEFSLDPGDEADFNDASVFRGRTAMRKDRGRARRERSLRTTFEMDLAFKEDELAHEIAKRSNSRSFRLDEFKGFSERVVVDEHEIAHDDDG